MVGVIRKEDIDRLISLAKNNESLGQYQERIIALRLKRWMNLKSKTVWNEHQFVHRQLLGCYIPELYKAFFDYIDIFGNYNEGIVENFLSSCSIFIGMHLIRRLIRFRLEQRKALSLNARLGKKIDGQ